MRFTGGYYLLRQSLLRSTARSHSIDGGDCVSDRALAAVNAIQATPWRINKDILSLLHTAWKAGDSLGNLPPAGDDPVPGNIPKADYDEMSRQEKHAFKAAKATAHARNDSYRSRRSCLIRKLQAASDLANEPAIYFPHFLDFRGRTYPMPQDLNPQGDDTAKALLEFGVARPLGSNGLDWLATKLAGCAGQDKLSYDDRVRWVNANLDAIEDSVDNPLDGHRFWASPEFDEPWGFLATAFEMIHAMRSPDHREYLARQPIPLDGSTNGLQHLSLMGRDEVGAVATNCSSSPDRHDLYQDVADVVADKVTADVLDGFASARVWAQRGITRKIVKRPCMTTPYGVTPVGIRDQIIADGFCQGMGMDSAKHATYLRDRIIEGLSETVSAAKDIMAYFQGVAGVLAEEGKPMSWPTPIGSRVTQSYKRTTAVRVKTLMGRVNLMTEDDHLMNLKKQRLAAAPNVVHSFDASMLMETVLRMADQGTPCFAMIHDSFSVHPDLTDDLARVLREVAYDIYKEDWLDRLDADFRLQCADPADIPSPPTRGTFDPTEVLDAPYFFS